MDDEKIKLVFVGLIVGVIIGGLVVDHYNALRDIESNRLMRVECNNQINQVYSELNKTRSRYVACLENYADICIEKGYHWESDGWCSFQAGG